MSPVVFEEVMFRGALLYSPVSYEWEWTGLLLRLCTQLWRSVSIGSAWSGPMKNWLLHILNLTPACNSLYSYELQPISLYYFPYNVVLAKEQLCFFVAQEGKHLCVELLFLDCIDCTLLCVKPLLHSFQPAFSFGVDELSVNDRPHFTN